MTASAKFGVVQGGSLGDVLKPSDILEPRKVSLPLNLYLSLIHI